MNLFTNSKAELTAHVHAFVCDVPMQMVVDKDQDLFVQPRHLGAGQELSIALPARASRLLILMLLHQLEHMLLVQLELVTNLRRGRLS